MVVVYVLESPSSGRLYIGHTADLQRRLREHGAGQSRSTRGRGPWVLLHRRDFQSRAAAMRFERRVKGLKQPRRVRELFEAG
jgi:putative endonuclease